MVDLAGVRDADHHAVPGALPPCAGHADVPGTPLVTPVPVVRGGPGVGGERIDHDQIRLRRFDGRVFLDGLDHCLLFGLVEQRVGLHDILGITGGLDDFRVFDLGGCLRLGQDVFLLDLRNFVLEFHDDPIRFR